LLKPINERTRIKPTPAVNKKEGIQLTFLCSLIAGANKITPEIFIFFYGNLAATIPPRDYPNTNNGISMPNILLYFTL